MIIRTTASLATLLAASGANADLVFGEPLKAPFDAQVGLEFISSSAGWTGEIRWDPTDAESLGTLAFVNKTADLGDTFAEIGLVEEGETLPLAYNVTTGVPALYQIADPETVDQFAYQWLSPANARVFVEDIARPGGDGDYNDAVFNVSFTAIPEPGPLTLAMFGMLTAARRRRDSPAPAAPRS